MNDSGQVIQKPKVDYSPDNKLLKIFLTSGHFLIALVLIAAIGYLNFLIIRHFFQGEFNQNLGSIEISYVQMAKFWSEGSGLWQPLWYFGYPWHVFYTPILPTLELLLHNFFGFGFGHGYRSITAVGYILVPISLFLFVWQIAKSKTGAFVAALIYSFAPSIFAFLYKDVAQDTFIGLGEPRRFAILVRWGEGPHTLALVFVPLFGLFMSRFLGKKRFIDCLFSAVFLGLAALTNAIAMWANALLMFAFFLSSVSEKSQEPVEVIKRFFWVALLSLGLIAFWYNSPFLRTFFREGGGALENWKAMIPWGIIVLALFFVGIWLLVRKFTQRIKSFGIAFFWFLMLFSIVFVYYASGESRLEYVPQALRLNTEADLAFSVLVGVIVSNLFLYLTANKSKSKILFIMLALLIFIFPSAALIFWGLKLTSALPNYARDLSFGPNPKIENTKEYRSAQKVKELVAGSQERVLVPGNYSFWLNYFIDTPQLRGALYQSSTHFWPEHIYYQITNGLDSEISLAWLKIGNIGKLVYSGPGGEVYQDFKVPRGKFDKVLVPITEQGSDIYYDVPLKNDSIAKVVDANEYKKIKKPFNAIDSGPIFKYVSWMEQKADKKLEVQSLSKSSMRIQGEVGKGEAVLVQDTYDSGWHVKKISGISSWKIDRDPLDFMVLVPRRAGNFQIELSYGRPLTVYLGFVITLLTFVYIIRKFLPFGFAKSKVFAKKQAS